MLQVIQETKWHCAKITRVHMMTNTLRKLWYDNISKQIPNAGILGHFVNWNVG